MLARGYLYGPQIVLQHDFEFLKISLVAYFDFFPEEVFGVLL